MLLHEVCEKIVCVVGAEMSFVLVMRCITIIAVACSWIDPVPEHTVDAIGPFVKQMKIL
jgi:hypothetical protein